VVDVVTDQLRTPAAASAATVMALGALVALVALGALVALVALGTLVAVVTATVATPATRAAATGWWCYAAGRDALLELLQFEIQMFHSLFTSFLFGI